MIESALTTHTPPTTAPARREGGLAVDRQSPSPGAPAGPRVYVSGSQSTNPIRVRVSYPLEVDREVDGKADRLVLRTSLDWNRDIEPRRVDARRTDFEFEFETREPFLYFKPVLLRGREAVWSIGKDYLAISGEMTPREVFPNFHLDTRCSACELRELTVGPRTHAYRVFFPPGYGENPLRRYPVLYMHDGQNLFFPEEAFGGEHWRVAETLTVLDEMNAVEQAIVVGIYPSEREVDYTLPGYEEYGRFIVDTLKPAIDREYQTKTGPADTAVMGSSLGGVVSLELAWRYPHVFGMAGCLSSTFGWRDDLRDRVASEPRRRIRLYLDSGWPRDNYEVTRDMRALLRSRGYREGVDLMYFAFPNALHNEKAWAMRAHLPFQFFFGAERTAV